jgi:Tfp pilus assembly protein PilN
MRAVNLLPKDIGRPQRRTPDPLLLVGGGGGFVVVVALAALAMTASGTLVEKRDALADAELRLQLLPEPAAPPSAADQGLAAEQQGRGAALTAALATRVSWDRILRRFSLVLPDDVWLTTLAATAPSGAPAAAGAAPTGFTMVGYTYSHDAVARFLSRLAVVPDLTNVQLRSSAQTNIAGREVVEFSIVADVSPEGAKS